MPAWQVFTVYGPLGIIFGLAVIFVRSVVDKMGKDRDAERQYSMETEKDLRERIFPLLAQVSQTMADAVKVITEVRAEMRVREEIERRSGGAR
jgi:hypothetical protein